MSRQESIEDDSDPNWKKIVGDKGNTPGNDRCVVLECGHTILVSLPSNSDGGRVGSWVGCMELCTTCMNNEEKEKAIR